MAADVNSFVLTVEKLPHSQNGDCGCAGSGFGISEEDLRRSSCIDNDAPGGNDDDDNDDDDDSATSAEPHKEDAKNTLGQEEEDEDERQEDEDRVSDLPFPGFVARTFLRLDQTMPPRSWCLRLLTWPYPFQLLLIFFMS